MDCPFFIVFFSSDRFMPCFNTFHPSNQSGDVFEQVSISTNINAYLSLEQAIFQVCRLNKRLCQPLTLTSFLSFPLSVYFQVTLETGQKSLVQVGNDVAWQSAKPILLTVKLMDVHWPHVFWISVNLCPFHPWSFSRLPFFIIFLFITQYNTCQVNIEQCFSMI